MYGCTVKSLILSSTLILDHIGTSEKWGMPQKAYVLVILMGTRFYKPPNPIKMVILIGTR